MSSACLTFEECVWRCWNSPDFMFQYRRLTGHKLGLDERTALEKLIDKASGAPLPVAIDDGEAKKFFDFIRDCIWFPLLPPEIRASLKNQPIK